MATPKEYRVEIGYEKPMPYVISFEGTWITLENDLAVWFNVAKHFHGESKAIADFYPLLADLKRRTIARNEIEKARITANNSRPEIEALIRAYN